MKILTLFLLLVSFVFAHKINLFVTSEKSKIDIYAYFASGAPCQKCGLTIKNGEEIILKDVLDEKGEYIYTSPYEKLNISIDAGSGHFVSQTIETEKLSTEKIEEHQQKEQKSEHWKILWALLIMAALFYILKRVKKRE
ncbi:MAG: hypothetical protein ACNI3C_06990 [Candidatus Marinarcus sp.]|uniref:hypothetical protein n=1 Tax=Candidatus Marinarcus sp. TaxID=3100987 RepID=UPI003B006AD9